ncbi:coiled-coil domain-containing protein 39-like isoform X2 [Coccinella septempunctata]|uniref:coiled-coil domain-containing protein 39-like isoform X2 n=1 Tax=Coccinella septempunctata TaxID=41139 RepID=UPI001D0942B6|nr:coiled-coil domain-containing protein 39-like isoform X2 [Coccinella septempunctata]
MIQTEFFKDVLKQLGWNEGFQIPVANDENKALEEQVAKLTLARLKAKNESELSSQKYDALERHFKFVTQENEQVEKLISAHKQRLDSENHYLRIATSERDRLIQDIRESNKRMKEIEEKNVEKKREVKRSMERMDKMKKETFWDEEALKAWEESLKKRHDDNNQLIKFSKQDEKKFLELEAKRASLQIEYMQRQKTVAKMVNDLINYESILERTGKTIQTQVAERNSLVMQWKETVKILHQRDDAISSHQDKSLNTMELIEREKESLKNEENLLNIEKNNNREIERDNEDLNSQYSKFQRDLDKVIQYVLFLNSEENSMKRQVTKTANDLETERCRAKTLKKERENKFNAIINLDKKIENLKEKFESLKIANMSISERCKHLEKLIEFEAKQHNVFLSDSDRLSQTLFRVQSKLSEQIEISGNKELEIANLATLVDGLQKMTKEAQSNVDKRKEIIYNMEFRIDQLEEKLALIEKQKNTEDDEDVYNRIKMLDKDYTEYTDTRNLLQDQISRIQDEMRRLTTAITNDEQKLAILHNKLQNEKLDYEGGLKQVAAAKAAAQEKQVEENILILKLKQFDQSMKKEEIDIYNLQKMKLNLEQAMRERDLEVKSKMELLNVQKRNLDEDRGRLRSDFKGRQLKVEQLQNKEAETMQSLQKKFVDLTDQQRILRKTLIYEKQDLKGIKDEMEELKKTRKELEYSLAELETEFNKLQNELRDKQEKVKRTENLMKKVESKLKLETLTKYDRDLEVQQISEANKNGLQKLCHVAEADHKLKAILENFAKENNIKLPDIKVASSRFSETSFSSSDIQSSLSEDLKSSRSSAECTKSIRISSKEDISGSCHCSSSSSVSVPNLILSFNANNKK